MRFTVVVPTRERCETLGATLRSCLDQDHPDLEVVVSDNASLDGTRDVVESLRDPRVRYVNTGRRVSMSRNWEFALAAVPDADTFVHFLGDDDALLPGALRDVEGLLRAHGDRALAWRKAEYVWPSGPVPSWRNLAIVPLENRLFRYDADRALRDVRDLWIPYYRCPSLYNSFLDARVLHEVRRRGGTFFHSSIPDAYSGFAALSRLPSYLYSTRPFTLNGASGKSTGVSYSGDPNNRGPLQRFLAEDDIPPHPLLKPVPGSIVIAAMEALYQANDHALDGRLRLVRPLVMRQVFREIATRDAERWNDTVGRLEAMARELDDKALQRTIAVLRRLVPNRPGPAGQQPPRYGLDDHRQLWVDLAPFGIDDVHAAARWVGDLLGPYRAPAEVRPYRRADKLRQRLGAWVGRRVPDWTL